MREITTESVQQAVRSAFLKANIDVTKVGRYLGSLRSKETSSIGRQILSQLEENAELAFANHMPSCQDTGMAVVFAEIGQEIHVTGGDLTAAINAGVRQAYADGYFRRSVADPLTRENTQDNTPAVIHYTIVPGDQLTIHALPKGFGSENMSAIQMLTPAAGVEGVLDFIVQTVAEKGMNACPPLIVGVGIGGTFEQCALMAKHALLREIGEHSKEKRLAELEEQLLTRINQLNIGPMGLGGKVTALAVNIECFATHIAGLPVAVNMQCHALRHETVVLS